MVVMTTSVHDIINISNQLEGIASMNGGRLAGIPLVLRRRPKKISTPSGEAGKRARREKWLVSIEADPEWVKAKLVKMYHDALPGNGLGEALQIAPPVQVAHAGPDWTTIDGDEGDDEDDERAASEVATETIQEAATTQQPDPPAPPTQATNGAKAKNAALKFQPFVTWCNEWVKDTRAAKYAKEEGGQANMFHILGRVSKEGFAEVTAENVEAIKAALKKHVEQA
jgi:hypothetical protein